MMRFAPISILAVATVASGAPEPVASPQMLVERHIDAFNRGDAPALAALYAEGATLVAPDGRVVTGRRKIEQFWASEQRSNRRRLRMVTSEEETNETIAWAFGNYSFTSPPERGAFTICLKRGEDRGWRIAASMWNAGWSVGYTPLQ